ncbi:CDC27 family protein [Lactobacillus sp. ESL0681]|uniref:tetratricopeptide repeat protein n=1 Tax=Lactobacillus sp. ESL0681 TaxID=2983211 RepID=UPI0023F75F84|nr:CDC27 family protein [Lactobacillus sp. ESL0681]WEV40600.1 tetratricopeptide repeat protein [Lactobacillus sp. ESL0681]
MTKKEAKTEAEKQKINQKVHQLITKIDANPQKTENYLELATYLLEQGSFVQATQLLEQAKSLVKEPQDLDYDLAVCYYMQGEFDKALGLLDQIPNDDLVLYQKALVYLKLGQPQKALAYALTIKQIDERVNELLGDIWLNLGEMQQAAASYCQIPDNKRSAKVNFLLGITVLATDKEQAKQYLAKSRELDSKYYEQALEQYAAILSNIDNQDKQDD